MPSFGNTATAKRLASAPHILATSARLMFVVIATRAVSFLKDIEVSRTFGTSPQLDSFLAAFALMSFIGSAISGASLSSIVPLLTDARTRADTHERSRLISVALAAALAGPGLIAIVAILMRRPLVALVAPGFSPEYARAMQGLLVELGLIPSIATLQAVVSATLNAAYGFRGAAATSAFTPLLIAAALLVSPSPSTHLLAAATTAGMLGEVSLLLLLARRAGIRLIARVSLAKARSLFSGISAQFLPLLASTALSSTSPLVDQAFASYMGEGAVATLSYGNRMTALAIGLGITSVGVVALPHFSELAGSEAWRELGSLLRRLGLTVFALAVPVAAAIVLLSDPIVRLLFQRGHFHEADVVAVAKVQGIYALQIPFHLTGIVAVRALNAMKKSGAIVSIVVVNISANFLGDYCFTRWYGLSGIALSTSLMYVVSCCLALVLALRELRWRTSA